MKGNGSTFELTFMRKTGQRFPVIVSAFTVLNRNGDPISYAATVKDITGRKQAEEAMRGWNQTLERRVAVRTAELKQSEDRFRQLVDATFEGVVISENGVVIDGNPQIAAMLGCDFPDMIGRPVTDFIAPESRALVLKRISEGFEAPYEYTGLRLDGTKVPMEAHGRMMIWQGKEARVTALRDLTSKKLAEARIEAQKAELDQALAARPRQRGQRGHHPSNRPAALRDRREPRRRRRQVQIRRGHQPRNPSTDRGNRAQRRADEGLGDPPAGPRRSRTAQPRARQLQRAGFRHPPPDAGGGRQPAVRSNASTWPPICRHCRRTPCS